MIFIFYWERYLFNQSISSYLGFVFPPTQRVITGRLVLQKRIRFVVTSGLCHRSYS